MLIALIVALREGEVSVCVPVDALLAFPASDALVRDAVGRADVHGLRPRVYLADDGPDVAADPLGYGVRQHAVVETGLDVEAVERGEARFLRAVRPCLLCVQWMCPFCLLPASLPKQGGIIEDAFAKVNATISP